VNCYNNEVNLNTASIYNLPLPLSPNLPKKQQHINISPTFSPGELGKLAARYTYVFMRLGWPKFFKQHHHQNISSMAQNLHNCEHPAGPFLQRLASNGIPTSKCVPTVVGTTTRRCSTRGPHPSAVRVHAKFLLEDMREMVCMGYWIVLPYIAI
jgi:hypothetical protein